MTWGNFFDPADLETFFREAKTAGAQTIEFRPPDEAMQLNPLQIRKIRSLAADNDLELMFCFAYPPDADMRDADPQVRRRAVEHLKRGIYAARELGGTELGGVLYSSWPTRFDDGMLTREDKYDRTQRSLDCIREVIPVAEECGMPLNLEVLNRYENYVINTVAQGVEFCQQINSEYCKLLLDVYHMNIEEDDLCGAITTAKGYIGHFHVSEPNRMIPYHTARIDWDAVGRALRDTGYDGTVTIEAVVSFDGPSTYNMRMWRDLLPDGSRQSRINAMRDGLRYIKSRFEG
nr:sugar phosphate isomerase/epimerase family protein [Anaerotruncus rubiinfantis]